MIRSLALVALSLMMSISALAADSAGFNKRFQLVKNDEGKVIAIRLRVISQRFTLKPFIEQIKNDILEEQRRLRRQGFMGLEAEVDSMLESMGLDPYAKDVNEETLAIKDGLMNLPNVNVEENFMALERDGLLKELESKIQNALLQLDLSLVANLDDPRFFYRRNVAYQVITWALDQAKKRFSNIPVLNLASFVIVKVHDLLHEQRSFHHNMMLHYFQNLPESELGMSKEEVDRAVSSIYEYRIGAVNFQESNRAAETWASYGFSKFYAMVRQGNTRARELSQPTMAGESRYTDYKRINFAFGEFTNEGNRKIYHLMLNAHMLSQKPALAYDYSKPEKVKRERALLNLGQIALGFIPQIPNFIKSAAETFINSMMKEQRLMEGALVAHFELNGNQPMVNEVYRQNINPYLLR